MFDLKRTQFERKIDFIIRYRFCILYVSSTVDLMDFILLVCRSSYHCWNFIVYFGIF